MMRVSLLALARPAARKGATKVGAAAASAGPDAVPMLVHRPAHVGVSVAPTSLAITPPTPMDAPYLPAAGSVIIPAVPGFKVSSAKKSASKVAAPTSAKKKVRSAAKKASTMKKSKKSAKKTKKVAKKSGKKSGKKSAKKVAKKSAKKRPMKVKAVKKSKRVTKKK